MSYNELQHYGIKGQRWGVRRYQNEDGSLTALGKERANEQWRSQRSGGFKEEDGLIKKGTLVKRISLQPNDPTFDNKKYVSITEDDHSKWDSYLGKAYLSRNRVTFSHTYIAKKDIRVMSAVEQGKQYASMLLDSDFRAQADKDTTYSNSMLSLKRTDDPSENVSRNIAAQTATGKKFVEYALKNKYGALFDTHGTNTADSPLIVLNPDSTLKKIDTDLSETVKGILDRLDKNRNAA